MEGINNGKEHLKTGCFLSSPIKGGHGKDKVQGYIIKRSDPVRASNQHGNGE